jgi:hypothetical protein
MLFAPWAPCIAQIMSCKSLRKLLLDEEGAQVGELPCAGDTQYDELDNGPANDACVCGFGLVAEFGFTFLCDVD